MAVFYTIDDGGDGPYIRVLPTTLYASCRMVMCWLLYNDAAVFGHVVDASDAALT